MPGRKAKDLTGTEFGSWRVIGRATVSKPRFYKWTCQCVCGKVKDVYQAHLTRGTSKSCGCMNGDRMSVARFRGAGQLHRGVVTRIARGAMTRNLPFTVSVEYLWELWEKQGGKCALSGSPIALPVNLGRSAVTASTASLDRIDNARGYVEGNVRWVHKIINIMRNRLTDLEFIGWCNLVVQHSTN